jgi:hypothetical protein
MGKQRRRLKNIYIYILIYIYSTLKKKLGDDPKTNRRKVLKREGAGHKGGFKFLFKETTSLHSKNMNNKKDQLT